MALALTLPKGFRSLGIPILSRLVRLGGNSGKLVAAKTLLRVIAPLFNGFQTVLLMDSWYMRCTLITYALEQGLQVIGLRCAGTRRSFTVLSTPASGVAQESTATRFPLSGSPPCRKSAWSALSMAKPRWCTTVLPLFLLAF